MGDVAADSGDFQLLTHDLDLGELAPLDTEQIYYLIASHGRHKARVPEPRSGSTRCVRRVSRPSRCAFISSTAAMSSRKRLRLAGARFFFAIATSSAKTGAWPAAASPDETVLQESVVDDPQAPTSPLRPAAVPTWLEGLGTLAIASSRIPVHLRRHRPYSCSTGVQHDEGRW